MIKPKDRKHQDFDNFLKDTIKDSKVKAEYDRLQPEFALIRAVLDARLKKGLTQEDLAQKIGTKQSVISRLESGRANPSFSFLKKIAHALNYHLEIRFTSGK
jgi:ribosome-binding protein aMBF1 (putative translation factor)